MPTDPQRMTSETGIDRVLREYITRERAVERPIDVRFVWTGPGVGIVTYAYAGDNPDDLRAASLPIEGDLADEVRRLEIGGPLPSDARPVFNPFRFPAKD